MRPSSRPPSIRCNLPIHFSQQGMPGWNDPAGHSRSLFCVPGLWLIGHSADRVDRNKCLGVRLLHVAHQAGVLVLVDNDDDLLPGGVVIGADALVDGGAAVEILEYELPQFLQLAGHDAHPPLLVKAEDEVVQDNAVEVGAQDAEHDGLGVVDEGGGQGHAHARHGHRLAQLHAEELVEQLGHHVQAAGGGVFHEQHGLADADHKEEADHVQKGIAHDGLVVGEDPLQNPQHRRHQYGGVHGLGAELPADEQEAQQQQSHVEDEGDDGDGQRDEVAEDNGQAGDAAHGEAAGDEEKEHRRRADDGAHRNHQKICKLLSRFHGKYPSHFDALLYHIPAAGESFFCALYWIGRKNRL